MNPNMDDIARKIRLLRERTVEKGCSEHEAMAAARKIGELMQQYRLSMSDIEIKEEEVVTEEFHSGRVQHDPAVSCLAGINEFCGVKSWFSKYRGLDGKFYRQYVFMGLVSDTENARYIFSICRNAITTGLEEFKKSDIYLEADSRRAASASFSHGMACSMNETLQRMAKELEPELKSASGTALVPLKNALVIQAMEKIGIKLAHSRYNFVRSDGFAEGIEAGRKVQFNRGVGSNPTKILPREN